MVKFLQVLGCRPNLTKYIPITEEDTVVWTGQHYDPDLAILDVKTHVNLGVTKLGEMIDGLTKLYELYKPTCVVIYGDTRSALAGAMAADNLSIPIAHIEAGARLHDDSRPEERIRKVIDNVSKYLFCVNEHNAKNLFDERITGQVYVVGDLHYDKYVNNREHGGYVVATIHRAEHTDNKEVLERTIECLNGKEKVYFPMHPRTKAAMKEFGLILPKNVEEMKPLKYLELQKLIKNAALVITDSGGLSREAWFSGVPVHIIGKSEWPEIQAFGDGHAAEKIRKILLKEVS